MPGGGASRTVGLAGGSASYGGGSASRAGRPTRRDKAGKSSLGDSCIRSPGTGGRRWNGDGHPPRNARRCGAGAARRPVLPVCPRSGDPRTLQADGDQPQRPRQGRGSGGGYAGAEIPHPGFPAPVLPHRKPRRQGLRQRHPCGSAIPALRKLRQ